MNTTNILENNTIISEEIIVDYNKEIYESVKSIDFHITTFFILFTIFFLYIYIRNVIKE